MNVLRLHGAGDLRLHREPIPEVGEREALVRVTSVGLCGSDLHWFQEGSIGDAKLGKPLVLGHEFAAVVEGTHLGSGGERVAVDPAVPCNECEFCQEGNPNLCIKLRFAGQAQDDGGLREYMNWPARCLYRLPDSLSDDEGALLEPLGVALHAIGLGHLQPGMSVGVFGCGPIGLLLLQLARIAGAVEIIATDMLAHRLDAARAFGATMTFEAHKAQEAEQVWAATNRRGVDVAFEAAGENAALETAVRAAKPGARIILVGIPGDDRTTFNASIARRKGLTLKLSRRMKHTYPRAIRLVESGRVDLKSLITHRFSLTEFDQAFSILNSRAGIKVMVQPSR